MSSSDAERLASHIVEPERLQQEIEFGGSDLVVVDMRGYVRISTLENGIQSADYQGAREEYLESHIPGAVYIDWTSDIVDILDPVPAQVADGATISRLFGNLGIGNATHIVAYDNHPAMQFATRLWWVCRYFGNRNVRVLHGGWQRWVDEKRPISSDIPAYPPQTFTATAIKEWIATAAEVHQSVNDSDPEVQIVDARDVGQYSGKIRRGRRSGHIPGAIHVPREALFDFTGKLKDPQTLRDVFRAAGIALESDAENQGPTRVVAYCNGGVAATSVLFALSIAGNTRLTNYDGSWNEWNLDDSLPVVS